MRITIDCFGEDFSPPDPDSVPQLFGFAEALRQARLKRDEDAVRSMSPKKLSGHLVISERKLGALVPDQRWRRVLGEEALIPEAMAWAFFAPQRIFQGRQPILFQCFVAVGT